MMQFLSLIALFLVFASPSADAAYSRFWRGFARPELTSDEFLKSLNEGLLPATGALQKTSVGILGYAPVVLPPPLVGQGFPSEVALLTYESEGAYATYRATPEGKAYGDLHWESFARVESGSWVPQSATTPIAMNQAYELGRAETTRVDPRFFQVRVRRAGISDAEYLAEIAIYAEEIRALAPARFVIAVMDRGWLEYSSLAPGELPPNSGDIATEFSIPLRVGRRMVEGSGIRYRFNK